MNPETWQMSDLRIMWEESCKCEKSCFQHPWAEHGLRFLDGCQKEHIGVCWPKSVVISLLQKSERAPGIAATAPKGTAGNRRGSFVPKHVTLFTSVFYVFCSVTGLGVTNGNTRVVPSGEEK